MHESLTSRRQSECARTVGIAHIVVSTTALTANPHASEWGAPNRTRATSGRGSVTGARSWPSKDVETGLYLGIRPLEARTITIIR